MTVKIAGPWWSRDGCDGDVLLWFRANGKWMEPVRQPVEGLDAKAVAKLMRLCGILRRATYTQAKQDMDDLACQLDRQRNREG